MLHFFRSFLPVVTSLKYSCFVISALGLSFTIYAKSIQVELVRVVDGDTIWVAYQGFQHKLRLHGIDAPELDQPFGPNAKTLLETKLFEKHLRFEQVGEDRYARKLAIVFAESVNVNLWLVEQGGAWVYQQYQQDPKYIYAQTSARQAKLGLWNLPRKQQVPPWKWRRQHYREKSSSVVKKKEISLSADSFESDP